MNLTYLDCNEIAILFLGLLPKKSNLNMQFCKSFELILLRMKFELEVIEWIGII